jgi:hypothetical protein
LGTQAHGTLVGTHRNGAHGKGAADIADAQMRIRHLFFAAFALRFKGALILLQSLVRQVAAA